MVIITFSSQPNHTLSCQPCTHSSAQQTSYSLAQRFSQIHSQSVKQTGTSWQILHSVRRHIYFKKSNHFHINIRVQLYIINMSQLDVKCYEDLDIIRTLMQVHMQENYTSRTDANHTPTNIIVNSSVERCVLAQPRHYIC